MKMFEVLLFCLCKVTNSASYNKHKLKFCKGCKFLASFKIIDIDLHPLFLTNLSDSSTISTYLSKVFTGVTVSSLTKTLTDMFES